MKNKLIYAVFTLLSSISISNADYQLRYPLEESNGGSLPNNSIIIKNNSIITPEPLIDCRFESALSTEILPTTYLWRTTIAGGNTQIVWAGNIIWAFGATEGVFNTPNEFVINGYTYTKGERQTFSGPPQHTICRENS